MEKFIRLVLCFGMILASSACTFQATTLVTETTTPGPVVPVETSPPARSCRPTLDDGVSPSYQSGAPEQTVVGHGHVLTGTILSSVDCQPQGILDVVLEPEK